MWVFVMVLGYSLAIYVEFVRPADVAPFMRCHVNGFEYFGGVPRRCLHHNAEVVVGRDESGRPNWNSPDAELCVASLFRAEYVPAVSSTYEGEGGDQSQVRGAQPVAVGALQ